MTDGEQQSLSHALQQDLMRELADTPAVLAAVLEGRGGPVSVPSEQYAAILEKVVWILVRHTTQIAAEVDRLRLRAERSD